MEKCRLCLIKRPRIPNRFCFFIDQARDIEQSKKYRELNDWKANHSNLFNRTIMKNKKLETIFKTIILIGFIEVKNLNKTNEEQIQQSIENQEELTRTNEYQNDENKNENNENQNDENQIENNENQIENNENQIDENKNENNENRLKTN